MSNASEEEPAWLEDSSHHRIPLRGSCSIGRSPSNQVALASDKVSGRHAIIHAQHENEFWLVDCGSRNGTYLNAQRVTMPQRLRDGDRVTIGPFEFTFLLPRSQQPGVAETVIPETIVDVRQARCWLLIADIVDSTRLFRKLPGDEAPVVTGQWLAECKQTIEEHGGRINQFLGDGFLAYWRERAKVPAAVAATLQAFRRRQEQAQPAFRIVAHYGEVTFGGMSLGEEPISGPEVHFAFRMEKLAGRLGEARLLSHAACERLAGLVEVRAIGDHALPGFESKAPMYAF